MLHPSSRFRSLILTRQAISVTTALITKKKDFPTFEKSLHFTLEYEFVLCQSASFPEFG